MMNAGGSMAVPRHVAVLALFQSELMRGADVGKSFLLQAPRVLQHAPGSQLPLKSRLELHQRKHRNLRAVTFLGVTQQRYSLQQLEHLAELRVHRNASVRTRQHLLMQQS